MDEETRLVLKTLAENHDTFVVKFAGLLSVVSAMVERERVDEWCRMIAGRSLTVGQTAIQRHAHDVLAGIDGASTADR